MRALKSLFILTLFFYSFTGFSQSDDEYSTSPTSKGKIVVGGSSSFNFSSLSPKTKSDSGTQDFDIRETSFSFTPNAAYFVIDNLAIGGGISFASDKTKADEFDFESTTTAFVFTPFARYYFTQGNIKPFLQGAVGIGTSKVKEESNSQENEFKNSIFSYGFDGGVAIFLNNNISIDLGIGYVSSSSKPRDNNDDNVRFVNNGFGFNAGFNIFF